MVRGFTSLGPKEEAKGIQTLLRAEPQSLVALVSYRCFLMWHFGGEMHTVCISVCSMMKNPCTDSLLANGRIGDC